MNTLPKLEKSTIALIISLAYQKPTISNSPNADIELELPNAVGYSKCMKWIQYKSKKLHLEIEAISIYETIAINSVALNIKQCHLLQRDFNMSRITLRKHEEILVQANIISIIKTANGKKLYSLLEPLQVIGKL